MKKHINVPVFIPHLGCPNDCVFCNQRTISGHGDYDFAAVKGELDRAFATADARIPTQIAYFGGSFTGIGRPEMTRLLTLANEYIDADKCESIRISTRPDYIDEEILKLLKQYRVRTIELGIQSMDDGVLAASLRGHMAADTRRACRLIRQYGFELVGQMMLGLPGADETSETETARAICDMGAVGARIYPTVVFRGDGGGAHGGGAFRVYRAWDSRHPDRTSIGRDGGRYCGRRVSSGNRRACLWPIFPQCDGT